MGRKTKRNNVRIYQLIVPSLLSYGKTFTILPTWKPKTKGKLNALPNGVIPQDQQTLNTAGAIVVGIIGGVSLALGNNIPSTTMPTSLEKEPKEEEEIITIDYDKFEVSIPCDATAKLAYDEWRTKGERGEVDEVGYENFKKLYYMKTVADVTSKRYAHEMGSLK